MSEGKARRVGRWRAWARLAWPRRLKHAFAVLGRLGGVYARNCPVCGYDGPFDSCGQPPRFDARCPGCRSVERHRLLFLADRELRLFREEDELLHFAPEPFVRDLLRDRVRRYVSADISGVGVDRKENIEALDLPDASFDAILCSHVLEHVDDGKALAELFRVLRPGGRLVLMIPLVEGWAGTYEDAAIQEPAARDLHFGQTDHVRWYGRDFRERVTAAGFRLSEYTAAPADCARHSLLKGEAVFLATR